MRLSKKKFKFQVSKCSNEALFALLGFEHNAVCPFGPTMPVPVIVAKDILTRESILLGGGKLDIKLRVSTADLVKAFPLVCDCTIPRQPSE
jgi:prolyl-tRNA editing enzyme YbaK/EbsC (Cys-tRNA(Pro) deacylase)